MNPDQPSTGAALRGGGLLGFSKFVEMVTPFREQVLRAVFGLQPL